MLLFFSVNFSTKKLFLLIKNSAMKNKVQNSNSFEFHLILMIRVVILTGISIAVVRANNPTLLKYLGSAVVLTEKWATGVLKYYLSKGTTGKFDPSPPFSAEGKFSFQRNISALATEFDIPIPLCLIINIYQTSLSYVNTEKFAFSFKAAKNVSTRGLEDKHQIPATFAAMCTGDFLPTQLIYSVKTKRRLPKFSFPSSFSVMLTENHWSNTEKSVEFFKEIIFPTWKISSVTPK